MNHNTGEGCKIPVATDIRNYIKYSFDKSQYQHLDSTELLSLEEFLKMALATIDVVLLEENDFKRIELAKSTIKFIKSFLDVSRDRELSDATHHVYLRNLHEAFAVMSIDDMHEDMLYNHDHYDNAVLDADTVGIMECIYILRDFFLMLQEEHDHVISHDKISTFTDDLLSEESSINSLNNSSCDSNSPPRGVTRPQQYERNGFGILERSGIMTHTFPRERSRSSPARFPEYSSNISQRTYHSQTYNQRQDAMAKDISSINPFQRKTASSMKISLQNYNKFLNEKGSPQHVVEGRHHRSLTGTSLRNMKVMHFTRTYCQQDINTVGYVDIDDELEDSKEYRKSPIFPTETYYDVGDVLDVDDEHSVSNEGDGEGEGEGELDQNDELEDSNEYQESVVLSAATYYNAGDVVVVDDEHSISNDGEGEVIEDHNDELEDSKKYRKSPIFPTETYYDVGDVLDVDDEHSVSNEGDGEGEGEGELDHNDELDDHREKQESSVVPAATFYDVRDILVIDHEQSSSEDGEGELDQYNDIFEKIRTYYHNG